MSRAEAEVVTFGCRLNAYESEVIRRNAAAAGRNDVVIINTCAVTAEAERQARQAIRRARRRRPEAEIIVTGCAVQLNPSAYAEMTEVDRVLGNAEKLDPGSLACGAPRVAVNDIMAVTETAGHLIEGLQGRARAFLQVQNGCDHRCTFCIIPFARGPSRSVPAAAIVGEARALVAAGYAELVLTGVDIGDYGRDLHGGPSLGEMVRTLLREVPELPRLRLSSIDPVEVDATLCGLFADEPRLMPHLHLSLQSGDDLILKRMKRRHRRGDAVELCEEIRRRRPETAFGADLIAGFPTESEAAFANTHSLIAECGLNFLHVFPYSERPGTPATRMPPVAVAERKRRAGRLRAAGAAAERRFLMSRVGTLAEVLVEREDTGRGEDFAPVRFDRPATPGHIVTARIAGLDGAALAGHLLNAA